MNNSNHRSVSAKGRSEPENDDVDRDPIDRIAEEFATRVRNGERPTIDAYCTAHPDLADEIRELFPGVLTMERLRDRKQLTNGKKVASPELPIERLGDFRVIREIARGGMGIVFEAEQVTLGGRRVAVKVLPKQTLRSERDIQRFEREAQTAAKLHHTNIVPIFGVGQQDGNHYIVMQLIRGVGLDEILSEVRNVVFRVPNVAAGSANRQERSSTVRQNAISLLSEEIRRTPESTSETARKELLETAPLAADNTSSINTATDRSRSSEQHRDMMRAVLGSTYYRNVARIGLQAANGLGHAHKQKTLHRDVKPGNLLLDDEGVVWVADFGIAKAFEDKNVTWTGDIVGTLSYMAPERFKGTADTRSDIYSLGLTLYELTTLERAFTGTDRATVVHHVTHDEIVAPSKLNTDVPKDLETIVLKATSRDPNDRYQSAEEVAFDLDCFLNNRPIKARRLRYFEQFSRWCRQNRAVASLAAVIFFLLCTVCTVTAFSLRREMAQRRQLETTSELAVTALDQIYGQFSPQQMRTISDDSSETEEELLSSRSQLPLSKDVALLLENLLQFYDDLSRHTENNERVTVKSITANRRVGDIQHRLGQLDEADAAYRRAIQRISQLDLAYQRNSDVRIEHARSHNGIGIVFVEKWSREQAAKAHREALDALDLNTDSIAEKHELARTLYLLHLAEHRRSRNRHGHKKTERTHLKRAIEILSDLPKVADNQFLLARCHMASSHERRSNGKSNDGESKAIEILEELVRLSPQDADYQYELGDLYMSMAGRSVSRRRNKNPSSETLANAEARIRRALTVTADLDLHHPNIPEYQMLKARMHHVLAKILEKSNQLPEAERQYDHAIEKQKLVVRQSRNPTMHEVWQYRFELERARLQREATKYSAAHENLEIIVGRLEVVTRKLAADSSSHFQRFAEKTLDETYVALSDVLRKMGREEEANAALRKAERDSF